MFRFADRFSRCSFASLSCPSQLKEQLAYHEDKYTWLIEVKEALIQKQLYVTPDIYTRRKRVFQIDHLAAHQVDEIDICHPGNGASLLWVSILDCFSQ